VKFNGAVLTVTTGATTLSVTGMLAGLPVAPTEVTVTEPLYIPAVVRLDRTDWLSDTLMEDGIVPLAVDESHEPPPVVEELVVKLNPEVPEMLTDCA
jgi:hypothetical protein